MNNQVAIIFFKFKFIFLVLIFLIPTYVLSEDEVLYCTETDATGFNTNDDNTGLEPIMWIPERFTMKVNFKEVTLETDFDYHRTNYPFCELMSVDGDVIQCMGILNANITFSKKYMTFTSSKAHGHIFNGDFGPLYFAYGECEKF